MPKEIYASLWLYIKARFSGSSNMFHNIFIKKCMDEPGVHDSTARRGGGTTGPIRP